jgi:hypothetical protein
MQAGLTKSLVDTRVIYCGDNIHQLSPLRVPTR